MFLILAHVFPNTVYYSTTIERKKGKKEKNFKKGLSSDTRGEKLEKTGCRAAGVGRQLAPRACANGSLALRHQKRKF